MFFFYQKSFQCVLNEIREVICCLISWHCCVTITDLRQRKSDVKFTKRRCRNKHNHRTVRQHGVCMRSSRLEEERSTRRVFSSLTICPKGLTNFTPGLISMTSWKTQLRYYLYDSYPIISNSLKGAGIMLNCWASPYGEEIAVLLCRRGSTH